MNPPHTERLRLSSGTELACFTAGDPSRPALLLLHGLPNSSRRSRATIPALAPVAFVIAAAHAGTCSMQTICCWKRTRRKPPHRWPTSSDAPKPRRLPQRRQPLRRPCGEELRASLQGQRHYACACAHSATIHCTKASTLRSRRRASVPSSQ